MVSGGTTCHRIELIPPDTTRTRLTSIVIYSLFNYIYVVRILQLTLAGISLLIFLLFDIFDSRAYALVQDNGNPQETTMVELDHTRLSGWDFIAGNLPLNGDE